MAKKYTFNVTIEQDSEGVWTTEDSLSKEVGVHPLILTSFEEWMYALIYSIQENLPTKRTADFTALQFAYEKETNDEL